jgi:predicted DNA-binding transcriptional regulator AlpA
MTENTPGTTTFVNEKDARAMLDARGLKMSRSTFIKGVADGKFPEPVRITPKRPVWRTADIQALISSL